VTKNQTLSIVLTMIVSFAATFAIATWQRGAVQLPAADPIPQQSPEPAMRPRPVGLPSHSPAAPVPPIRAQAPAIAEALQDPPPAEMLPVSVHLMNRHGQRRIELIIANNSSSALDMTVRLEAASDHQAAETSIRLEPGQQRSFGDAEGLQMQAGDRVMLHNAQFRDWVGEVPP